MQNLNSLYLMKSETNPDETDVVIIADTIKSAVLKAEMTLRMYYPKMIWVSILGDNEAYINGMELEVFASKSYKITSLKDMSIVIT
jgi:hypothetical protein